MIPLAVSGKPHHGVEEWLARARAHNSDLYRHSLLVSHVTAIFSVCLGFSIADQCLLAEAALLHDIGKIEIPGELLRKPAALTASEMTMMKTHPAIGQRLLSAEGGHSDDVLTIAGQHHERLDGTGYPNGLLAAEIGEPVRIVTLCDIYCAMTEPRPYGVCLSGEEALATMARKRTRLDLALMQQFAVMASVSFQKRIERMRHLPAQWNVDVRGECS